MIWCRSRIIYFSIPNYVFTTIKIIKVYYITLHLYTLLLFQESHIFDILDVSHCVGKLKCNSAVIGNISA
jgi:hypothetical protein